VLVVELLDGVDDVVEEEDEELLGVVLDDEELELLRSKS
jgi:hypothetical protein